MNYLQIALYHLFLGQFSWITYLLLFGIVISVVMHLRSTPDPWDRKEVSKAKAKAVPELMVSVTEELKRGTCTWWPASVGQDRPGPYVQLRSGPYSAEIVELDTGWALCSTLLRDRNGLVFTSMSKARDQWRFMVAEAVLQFVSVVTVEDGMLVRMWLRGTQEEH